MVAKETIILTVTLYEKKPVISFKLEVCLTNIQNVYRMHPERQNVDK